MNSAHMIVLLVACAIAGCGAGSSQPQFLPPSNPSSRYIDADAPLVPARAFDTVSGGETLGELVQLLGPAHGDVGSGVYVLVWRGADGRSYSASVANLKANERPVGGGFKTR